VPGVHRDVHHHDHRKRLGLRRRRDHRGDRHHLGVGSDRSYFRLQRDGHLLAHRHWDLRGDLDRGHQSWDAHRALDDRQDLGAALVVRWGRGGLGAEAAWNLGWVAVLREPPDAAYLNCHQKRMGCYLGADRLGAYLSRRRMRMGCYLDADPSAVGPVVLGLVLPAPELPGPPV